MGIDRLDEILPNEPAPSKISQFGTEYVRREYFQDGNIIYLSPLDFVLNGPDEGEEIVRMRGPYTNKVKMGQRHYENNSNVPFMCEVFVTVDYNSTNAFKDWPLWVVIEATELAVEKFKLRLGQGATGFNYSLQPQFFFDKGRCMSLGSDNNSVSVAFSTATGIPYGSLIIEDRLL